MNRTTGKIDFIPDWRNLEHNSGCTSIVKPPQFDINHFPYLIARNRFKVDLVDVKNMRVEGLASILNTPGMQSKLGIQISRDSLDIYYNNCSSDGEKSFMNRLSLEKDILQ